MHSDVRNANVIRDSLQAIEQLSRLARISLDLQSTHTFRHACQELMSFLYEPIYPQEVVQSSIMSCLQLITDNATIDQLDVASKTLVVAIDKLQSVSAQSTLQTWSRRLQSLKSEHDSKQMSNRATLDCMRHVDHALGPIKLRSGHTSMHWPFFVGANTFSRLHTNIMPSNPPPTSALLQLLVIRTSTLERNHTYCPPTLTVMLNGVTLKFGAKAHNSVKAKSANINFAITGDGVMDISRLIVKGKNVLLVKRDSKAIEDVHMSIETYIVENQETVSARVKEHCIPEKTWKSMLKRLLNTGDTTTPAPSPPSNLIGSLVLPRHNNTDDATDLLAISQSVFRISTRCPITLRAIRQPIRGSDCKHYECFELDSYLLVNRGLAPWKCPHCNNTSTPEKLVYDTFLEKMFATLPNNAAAIEFRKDEMVEDGFSRKVIYDKVMDEPFIKPVKHAQDTNKQNINNRGSNQPSFTIVEIDD